MRIVILNLKKKIRICLLKSEDERICIIFRNFIILGNA